MKYKAIRDIQLRNIKKNNETNQKELISIQKDKKTPLSIKNIAKKKISIQMSTNSIRNRCIKTNKSRAIINRYGYSRYCLRMSILEGLTGVIKKSWLTFLFNLVSFKLYKQYYKNKKGGIAQFGESINLSS